jgi:hypothetical protein
LHEAVLALKTHNFVILAYDFASALALSVSEYPCGAKAGIHLSVWLKWIPAFAGMTDFDFFVKKLAIFRFVQSSLLEISNSFYQDIK